MWELLSSTSVKNYTLVIGKVASKSIALDLAASPAGQTLLAHGNLWRRALPT
jgi:hypothetical protein